MLADQDAASVVVVDETLRRTRIARSDIAAIDDSGTSFMPEGLLTALNPQELRDLFAYLQK
jgi:hypothetical protein